MLFASVAISFCFIWSLIKGPENIFPGGDIGNRVFGTFVLGVVLYYTGLAAVNYLYAMTSPNAKLTADIKGIDDSLTIFSIGSVKWSDIDSVDIENFFDIDLLLIKLKDPESIVAQQSRWKRRRLNKFLKKWGTPMVISQRIINYDVKKLRSQIQERLHN